MIDLKLIPITSGIYKITNKINNKCYIGQAQNLRKRIRGHLRGYNLVDSYFYKSIRKYKIENFQVEILVQGNFNQDELNDLEIDFIRLYNCKNPLYGYNLTEGGKGSSGYIVSEETRKKQSESAKNKKPMTEETKKKISEGNKGRKISKETKQKQIRSFKSNKFKSPKKIAWNKGQKVSSEELLKKLSESHKGQIPWNKGKNSSDETRQKLKESHIGKKDSEETRLKKSISLKGKNLGKKRTDEQKKVLSEAHKGKKQTEEQIEKRIKTREFNKNMKLIQENNFIYD